MIHFWAVSIIQEGENRADYAGKRLSPFKKCVKRTEVVIFLETGGEVFFLMGADYVWDFTGPAEETENIYANYHLNTERLLMNV